MINGLGIRNFRSFGNELQLIGPLKKVNLLAGKNNAGKSNALMATIRFLSNKETQRPTDLDLPQHSASPSEFEMAIAIEEDHPRVVSLVEQVTQNSPGAQVREYLDLLLKHRILRLTDDNLIWLRYSFEANRGGGSQLTLNRRYFNQIEQHEDQWFAAVSAAVVNQSGGNTGDNAYRVMNSFSDLNTLLRPIADVKAFRQIRPGDPVHEGSHTGLNLIRDLQRLQNPASGPERQTQLDTFRAINRFVQSVLEDPDARIEVPYDASTLNIEQDGITLPLEYFGTGLHHVVILAVVASVLNDHLICVEEPEVHLHPILQRKLIRYLSTATSNQYVIATHSAQMLDHEHASIFRVRKVDGQSTVSLAKTPVELSEICADLGYRASDILQSNAIIWVEGPSDRIYLRRWLSAEDDELVEGVHYSIMFYGGRLLNHLTSRDPEIEDFISLRRLNRNVAILIDTDKTSPYKKINETKRRVVEEFDDDRSPGFAWLTDGYTIENYIPADILGASIAEVYPNQTYTEPPDKWTDPLKKSDNTRLDKIKIASAVCSRWSRDRSSPDLRKQIKKAIQFVREANGLPPAPV